MLTKSRPDPLPINDTNLVIDIGGGLNPHPRANYVLDMQDFATVKPYNNSEKIGRFTSDTWIVHDICSSKPFPFPDKFFDFAICTHVLEDVRDLLRVCEEIQRVAKAGYIEVPSMESEITHNLETRHYAGRWHHRWLVEVTEGDLIFRYKPHFVNGYWKTQLPRSWWKKNAPERDIRGLLWKDSFKYQEMYYSQREFIKFLEHFVQERQGYPNFRYYLFDWLKSFKHTIKSLRKVN